MRLIDADAFKLELQGHFETVEQDVTISSDFQSGAIMGLEAAEFAIRCTPSIDAAPVVHGRWERQELAPPSYLFCSECGFPKKRGTWNFCPNCGAMMDGGDK